MTEKKVELVEVSIDNLLYHCNRLQTLIELKRKELIDNEIDNMIKLFNYTPKEALMFIEKTASNSSLLFTYKDNIYYQIDRIINKCLEYKENNKSTIILEKKVYYVIENSGLDNIADKL